MTVYWRSGHMRTGRSGGSHWVCGHWVSRDGWGGLDASATGFPTLDAGGGDGEPNSHCPICGAEVYFYANAYGSAVYFDALGPPWPKHPCFPDVPRESGSGGFSSGAGDIFDALEIADWLLGIVFARTDEGTLSHFIVTFADPGLSPQLFDTALVANLPRTGETLGLRGDRISYFSLAEREPRRVAIDRKPPPPGRHRDDGMEALNAATAGDANLLAALKRAIEQAVLAILGELRRATAATALDREQLRTLTVSAIRETFDAAFAAASARGDDPETAAELDAGAGDRWNVDAIRDAVNRLETALPRLAASLESVWDHQGDLEAIRAQLRKRSPSRPIVREAVRLIGALRDGPPLPADVAADLAALTAATR